MKLRYEEKQKNFARNGDCAAKKVEEGHSSQSDLFFARRKFQGLIRRKKDLFLLSGVCGHGECRMTISSFLFEICRPQIQRISSAESLWKGRRQTNLEFLRMSLVLDISETKIFFPPLNNWFLFISKSEKLEVAKISGRKENFREAKKNRHKLRLKRAKFAVSAFWTQCDT